MAQIAQTHRIIRRELGVPVALVAIEFERAMEERPGLAMLGHDKEHGSIHGTYLAANVIYSTIVEQSHEGLPYYPTGLFGGGVRLPPGRSLGDGAGVARDAVGEAELKSACPP